MIAVATALTLVPALLTMTGRRLAKPGLVSRIPGLRTALTRTADVQSEEGVFSALATRVQRRPWWVLGGVLVVLAVLALPLGSMQLRNSMTELLPAGSTQRGYLSALADQYPTSSSPTVVVVAQTSILIATGSLPGAKIESELSRAGIKYSITDGPRPIDDGALSRVYLRKI